MPPILNIRGLRKSYGDTAILRDIDVSIERGDFLVLVGPSGCGKSTLLNCIAGLEPINGGSIEIDGRDMTRVPPKDRDIAMVFQSYALYPTMTVARNITFGMQVRGVDKATQAAKLSQVARQLQIDHLLERRPAQLSGGQRQRVAMGRALVREPKLFLFDEPLSNLDAKLRVEMRTEIKRLHQTLGTSMVYVTHDQIEAMTLATQIVVMKGGVIQQIGSQANIYARPANTFVADFMGSPAMNLIPAEVRSAGGGGQVIRIDRPGEPPLDLPADPGHRLPDRIILGLRPEDIGEVGQRQGPQVRIGQCRVDVVEPAGADTYVVTRLGGVGVTARLGAETAARPGAPHDFGFDLGRASFFQPDTGLRIG